MEARTPSPSRTGAAMSQEAFMSEKIVDSLALSSYLKLRQENRSPYNTGNGSAVKPNFHKRELFEEFKFQDDNMEGYDIGDEKESEHSLSFTENFEEVSEMDFKAMRLLVQTSMHEKVVAQSKVAGLEEDINNLVAINSHIRNPRTWQLPLAVIEHQVRYQCNKKAIFFHRWKGKVVTQKMTQHYTEREQFILKLARRNILKVRTVYLSRTFNRWNLQHKHALDAVDSYGLKTAIKHKRYLLQGLFKLMVIRRVQRRSLRHLNRIARNKLFRSYLTHWKLFTIASYRTQLKRLQQGTTFASLAQSLVASREQMRTSFLSWAVSVREDKHRLLLHNLAQRRLRHIYNRYTSPVAHAFGQWRQITTSFYPKLKAAMTVWTEAVRKSQKFLLRKALVSWKEKCRKYAKIGARIAGYLQSRAECSLRTCFAKLVAAQQAHLRHRAKAGVDRWIRRFFLSVDNAQELTCRSVLSARFRHWHHATHTDRSASYYEGRLQDVQGSLRRTETSLQSEQQRKKELSEKYHQDMTAYQARISASKFMFMGRILRNMQHSAKSRGFRKWVQYTLQTSHLSSLAQLQLSERSIRVKDSLLRWSKRTAELNLANAVYIWRLTCTRLNGMDHLLKKRRTSTARVCFEEWQAMCWDRKLQKKVIKRMSRTKTQALLHLAWEKWHRKVTALKDTCKKFVKTLISKRNLHCKFALNKWKQVAKEALLSDERSVRDQLEASEHRLALRLAWSNFQCGVTTSRQQGRHLVQLVVSKITERVRDGFQRWLHVVQREHRMRSVCVAMIRQYAHCLNKKHLLAFAKWKALVWDYQKISFQEVQKRLSEAQDRIYDISEQQLSLETSAEHLKAHNDRADRIARTLYQQVHRMLATRRHATLVKSCFDAWKDDHVQIKQTKKRLKHYILRMAHNSNTVRVAGAFRVWVLEAHHQVKQELEGALRMNHDNHVVLRRSFDQWQAYRHMLKMKMVSVIIRLKTGLQVGNQNSLSLGFAKWKEYTRNFTQYRRTMLEKYFEQWSVTAVENVKKKKVLFRLFPKLNAANVSLYFRKWKANSRILGLLNKTIMRMLEVSRLNRTYVSTVRLRACWNRWHRTIAHGHNQMKACRMVVQCYRKILRNAVFTWRRNCDYYHNTLQIRRMAMKKLLQMAHFHMLNRFFIWKVAANHIKQSEEHVERMGVVLKRLRFLRRKRRAWSAWKGLFRSISAPVTSSVASLKVNGPKYVNAITRAQYWSSSLLRSVLTNTTLNPVLELALAALHSIVPELTPSLYYLHHEHAYLQGHALRVQQANPQDRFRADSPLGLDRTISALKNLKLSRRYSPVPHERSEHEYRNNEPHVEEFFPHSQSLRFADDQQQNLFGETPFRASHSAPSSVRRGPDSKSYLNEPSHFQSPGKSHRSAHSPTRQPLQEDTTVLMGEGVVGRCAAQRCLQVYREGIITDGVYSQRRLYCSMNVPVPENAHNINITPVSLETTDRVATCVLPIVWGGNVVAVLQLTAPDLDPSGVFYDADRLARDEDRYATFGGSQEMKNRAVKHMSVTLRDLVDFSDVNADPEFAASFSVDASQVAGPPQSMVTRARTLRGQMMYQLMQLSLELRLDEERSVAFMSLVSTLAETFGRHFPVGVPHSHSAEDPQYSRGDFLNASLQSLQRSPAKEDFTLPFSSPRAASATTPAPLANGSFVGLAHYFSRTTTELHHTDTMHRTLVSETENLSHIVEKLKRSREKYLHKSEQLQTELTSSLQHLEEERTTNKKLLHSVKKAEARLRTFEQQQIEIDRLNSYMRSAAHKVLK